MHAEAPDAEYKPGEQLTQTAEVVAPVPEEEVPAEQLTQVEDVDALVAVEYDPATQLVQLGEPELAWKVPTAHPTQTKAPALEYKPARQLTHAVDREDPVVGE